MHDIFDKVEEGRKCSRSFQDYESSPNGCKRSGLCRNHFKVRIEIMRSNEDASRSQSRAGERCGRRGSRRKGPNHLLGLATTDNALEYRVGDVVNIKSHQGLSGRI